MPNESKEIKAKEVKDLDVKEAKGCAVQPSKLDKNTVVIIWWRLRRGKAPL